MNNYEMNPLEYALRWWGHHDLATALAFYILCASVCVAAYTIMAAIIRHNERKRMELEYRRAIRKMRELDNGAL